MDILTLLVSSKDSGGSESRCKVYSGFHGYGVPGQLSHSGCFGSCRGAFLQVAGGLWDFCCF